MTKMLITGDAIIFDADENGRCKLGPDKCMACAMEAMRTKALERLVSMTLREFERLRRKSP